MTKPQERRVKTGVKLGAQLEFYTVVTTLDIAPGMKTEAELIAEVAARTPTPVAGADMNEIVKETDGQARLDYFVAAINVFAQPVILNIAGDTLTFAFEHIGCASVAKIQAALAAAIVDAGDAADVAAAAGKITVTKQ